MLLVEAEESEVLGAWTHGARRSQLHFKLGGRQISDVLSSHGNSRSSAPRRMDAPLGRPRGFRRPSRHDIPGGGAASGTEAGASLIARAHVKQVSPQDDT